MKKCVVVIISRSNSSNDDVNNMVIGMVGI